MSTIETGRAPFFPRSKEVSTTPDKLKLPGLNPMGNRNTIERYKELKDTTASDAKVSIPTMVKDFSRIKKAVDQAPPIDNTEKIARLKEQIGNGTYQMDYDAIAEKMLTREF